MIIAVDFDGILFEEGGYPGVGKPILKNIKLVKSWYAAGVHLILWTCRDGEPLANAVRACSEYGIYFVSINENDPSHKWDGPKSTKVYADYYFDDRNISVFSRRKLLRRVSHGLRFVGKRHS